MHMKIEVGVPQKMIKHEVDDGSNDLGSEGRQIVSEIRPDDVD